MKSKLTQWAMVPFVFLCFLYPAGIGNSVMAKPEEAITYAAEQDPREGLGGDGPIYHEDMVNDFTMYEGVWLGAENNRYDHIDFDAEGNWWLYRGDEVVDEGYLRYEPEWEGLYAYSNLDDSGSRVVLQEGELYITSFGYFHYGDGMEYYWYVEGGGDHDGPARG